MNPISFKREKLDKNSLTNFLSSERNISGKKGRETLQENSVASATRKRILRKFLSSESQ